MGEHHRHDAAGLQHPPTLLEDRGHALLVVPSREGPAALLSPVLGRIGDRFVVLVGQVAAEQIGEDMPGRALEPDVEEVRQLGVHDVVIVRRIHDDRVDAAVFDVVEAVGGLAGDGDGGRRGAGPFEEASVAARFGADQGDELLDALGSLPDGPVVAHSGDQGSHLGV